MLLARSRSWQLRGKSFFIKRAFSEASHCRVGPAGKWDVHPFSGFAVSVLGSPWGQPCYLLLALAPGRQNAAGGGLGGSRHPVAKCKLVMAAWSVAFSELCL